MKPRTSLCAVVILQFTLGLDTTSRRRVQARPCGTVNSLTTTVLRTRERLAQRLRTGLHKSRIVLGFICDVLCGGFPAIQQAPKPYGQVVVKIRGFEFPRVQPDRSNDGGIHGDQADVLLLRAASGPMPFSASRAREDDERRFNAPPLPFLRDPSRKGAAP
jgi:hypothetical protein